MKQSAIVLQNKGMQRDSSISKADNSFAYENHNIRILSRGQDTMFSVTNERGNTEIALSTTINGSIIGWNVLGNHLILFATDPTASESPDSIYRIDYDPSAETFTMQYGNTDVSNPETPVTNAPIFNGDLGFSVANPIESIVYYENASIQKIYWVDGANVLRFMNFMADTTTVASWVSDNTIFDSTRSIVSGVSVAITKSNSGNTRANGVVQYLISYYNKFGQQSGYAWISDLVYLSPIGVGGAADSTNTNSVKLDITGLDDSFDYFRVYSIFRSSLNGQPMAYIVSEGSTSSGTAVVVDNGSNLTEIDPTELLYLGGEEVHAGTITHKDQTLFLGDLKSVGREGYDAIETAIAADMYNSSTGESTAITFVLTNDDDTSEVECNIPYVSNTGLYPYENQLAYTSAVITTFKGNEKYRFALMFRTAHGVNSDAFWIGDKTNTLYPVIDSSTSSIRRVVAECAIPAAVAQAAYDAGFRSVQLMIAEASYSDRSVKAQGIINPTMFNVWERYNDRLYSQASWISRPRGSNFACRHFEPVHNSIVSEGEIDCNYWDPADYTSSPNPYYQIENYGTSTQDYTETLNGAIDADYIMILYRIYQYTNAGNKYSGSVMLLKGSYTLGDTTARDNLLQYSFSGTVLSDIDFNDSYTITDDNDGISIECIHSANYTNRNNAKLVYDKIKTYLIDSGVDENYIVDFGTFRTWAVRSEDQGHIELFYNAASYPDSNQIDWEEAANYYSSAIADRWYDMSSRAAEDLSYAPSYYKKHLMFVDENVLTVNSPEIDTEAISIDNANLKLRIVGVSKITGNITDYVVSAEPSRMAGESLQSQDFNTSATSSLHDGLIAWPLWRESALSANSDAPVDVKKRTSEDYDFTAGSVMYWLRMWNHSGKISGYTDEDSSPYSELNSKTVANERISYWTIYEPTNYLEYPLSSVRDYHYLASQYVSLNIKNETKYYDANIDSAISVPSGWSYPVSLSSGIRTPGSSVESDSPYLYLKTPIELSYYSSPHAVVSLYSYDDLANNNYLQWVLPKIYDSDVYDNEETSGDVTNPIIPWAEQTSTDVKVAIYKSGALRAVLATPTYSGTDIIAFTITDTETNIRNLFENCWVPASRTYDPVYVLLYDGVYDTTTYLVKYADVSISEDGTTVTFAYPQILAQAFETDEVYVVCDAYIYDSSASTLVGANIHGTLELGQQEFTINNNLVGYSTYRKTFAFNASTPNADELSEGDAYLFIGELYEDFSSNDTRYGGISEAAIESNTFIPAGPSYGLGQDALTIVGNESDTYFQRYDCLKTMPVSAGRVNSVIDITSVMLETHINIDGRSDKLRGITKIASIDTAEYNTINPVYSQSDNFITGVDTDSSTNLDNYRSSITWTRQKADGASIDAWTHITLASTLALDGDKGYCRALRRMQNSIVAFQDKGIAEVLFNSRTQLSTTSGVPVEIANSGKVDGKRYITNKYGCINKWSIVEGKSGLYFVDSINKSFCRFSGNGIEDISLNQKFSSWFKANTTLATWIPNMYSDFCSFYDRKHSDIYLTSGIPEEHQKCLVFNEDLNSFTSFFDYDAVPMMTNIGDKFIAAHEDTDDAECSLWIQNTGAYGKLFDTDCDFSVQYRITPDPFGDKLWSTIDYRADFFEVLNSAFTVVDDAETLVDGWDSIYDSLSTANNLYLKDETFDSLAVWNEYQKASRTMSSGAYDTYPDIRKKFRIWHMDIPRATAGTLTNIYGRDRIRNPWINLRLSKSAGSGNRKKLMQLHDVVVKYFEGA